MSAGSARRKAALVRRHHGRPYTERRLYLQGGPASLIGASLGKPAKMAHRSKK